MPQRVTTLVGARNVQVRIYGMMQPLTGVIAVEHYL